MHQLYLSTHHIAPHHVEAYARALRQFRPTHMIGYPSSAAVLARAALAQGVRLPPLRVFLSNAECLTPEQRATIAEAFGCAVRDTYGMGEASAAASECAHGSLHLWPDAGVIEILDDEGCAVAPGSPGNVIVTGLVNEAMPLVRYRTGDRAVMADADYRCGCGRSLPVMIQMQGRETDLIVTRDGRRIFWLNPVFYGLPVEEGQIVQESLDFVEIRVVQGSGWTPAVADELKARLRARVGAVTVEVNAVDRIPRDASGKFRAVVSQVS